MGSICSPLRMYIDRAARAPHSRFRSFQHRFSRRAPGSFHRSRAKVQEFQPLCPRPVAGICAPRSRQGATGLPVVLGALHLIVS